MGKLTIEPLRLHGTYAVTTNAFQDHRGRFGRMFCNTELSALLQRRQIMQINHSLTTSQGAVRGLHFQYPPAAEMKLVRCTGGRAWDVMVDLRPQSPTFLEWQSIELSPEALNMVIIPEGFAHGFQSLEPNTELFYLCTMPYNAELEAGLNPHDPRLGISWPLPVTDISKRDAEQPMLDNSFKGISLP